MQSGIIASEAGRLTCLRQDRDECLSALAPDDRDILSLCHMSAQHNEAQPPISHCYARRTPSAVSSPPEPVAGRVSPLRCAVESRRVGGVRRQNPCRALDSARIGSGRTVLRPVHVRYPRRPSLTAVAALELTAAADATSNANARKVPLSSLPWLERTIRQRSGFGFGLRKALSR